jgi:hypothetical protein
MSYTPTTIIGKRLVERLEPWLDEGGDLARLCDSIGTMAQPVMEALEETGYEDEAGFVPAYGVIFNPETCPHAYLPYLGQFVGVAVPTGSTEAEARALVKAEAGLQRGTRAAVEATIARVLGEGISFAIEERTNNKGEASAWWFQVIVPKGHSSTALKAAIEAAKPAGLMFSIVESENAWIEGGLKWSEVKAGLKWSTPPKEGEY